MLREEYFTFSAMSDEQLYHLAFSEHHQPFYFHEFVQMIGDVGLQFLGDSDLTRLYGPQEPPAVRAFLDELPRVDQQQCLDFLTNCTCRGALVCHRDVQVRNRPERRPEFVAFGDLVVEPSALPTDFFMEAYAAGMIDVALSSPHLSSRISDRPTVSPLVRLQAQDGSTVTNQTCEAVRLTDLVRHVVTLLDGVHTRNDVTASVAHAIKSGTFQDDWIVRLEDHELESNA